ncbi:MAG: hypothetical protein B5M56_01730 [Desulfococcus sp. 4484_241]|nr:MAG: hypothetical protein B5M56_01730 [Desulfococcus sp. 4484_241]RLC31527.1 MAG: hypothetical protein DRH32_04095 [Deltaproteobacteria bacterium]
MKKTRTVWSLFLILAAVMVCSSAAIAYNQNPNLNYGHTNLLDAMLPPPGLYLSNYMIIYSTDEFKDSNGDNFPLNNEMDLVVYSPQFIWLAGNNLPGDLRWGIQALLPLYGYDVNSGLGLDSGGGIIGDLCVGPFVGKAVPLSDDFVFHWFAELDVYSPVGAYDKNYAINPSANYWTIEPFVSMTLQMPHGLTFSTRQHLAFNTKNDEYVNPVVTGNLLDHELQPGKLWHFNYSVMKTVDFISPMLRVGVAGYYGHQLEDDEVDGVAIPGTKEKIFAIGPAVHYIHKGTVFSLKTYFENGAENRPEGDMVVFRIIMPL